MNLSSWYMGRIGLENKVIDLNRWKVRKKINDSEVGEYYDECVNKLDSVEDYFEDSEAFHRWKTDLLISPPDVVAREPRRLGFYSSKKKVFNELKKQGRGEDQKYFLGARFRFSKDSEKYVIEIPNDETPAEAKASTFYNTLSYFLFNYLEDTKRLLFSEKGKSSYHEIIASEGFSRMHVTQILTDFLLADDKEALFEHRWRYYEMLNSRVRDISFFLTLGGISCLGALGILVGPYFTPLIPLPILLRRKFCDMYKNSKKDEFTKSADNIQFKI